MARNVAKYRAVRGPYALKNGTFRIQLVCPDNRLKQKTFNDKEVADKYIREVNSRIIVEAEKSRTALDVPEYEDTIAWVRKTLGILAYNLAVTQDMNLVSILKAVASAGIAIKQLYDTADLEAQFEQLQLKIKEIQSARAHGTRITWSDKGGPTVAPPLAANE